MSSTTLMTDRFWTEFQSLLHESREAFLSRLVEDEGVREELEDLMDLALATHRATEPTRPLKDVLNDLKQ